MPVSRRHKDRGPLNQIAKTPTSDATATGNPPSSVEPLASGPTHHELARRAYRLFEERGR
jgi:hypothetical protein